jgi:biotin transport system substrate-specific component
MTSATGTLSARLTAAVPSLAARRALGVVAFAALTAAGAKIALMLPGTPVPFTFQVAAVLLAGAMLGPVLGAASQVVYLAAGAAGLPVFAAGGGLFYLLGPTGGYLLAYPLAAYVAGWVLGAAPSVHRTALALGLGLMAVYAGGLSWLSAWAGMDTAIALGLRPFLIADLAKAVLVLLVVRRYRDVASRVFGS